ncbi:MAG: cyanophycin synthetase [Microbacterium sp.]
MPRHRSTWACRARATWASSTASSSTVRSSDDRHTSALELTTLDDLASVGLAAPWSRTSAASALARSLDVSPASIRDALASFRLDPHRIEVVAVASGVTWVDDSKATNPHAAASSLAAFPGAVWVVGGDLKGVDISDLVAARGAECAPRSSSGWSARRSPERSRDTRRPFRCSRSTTHRLKTSWRRSSNWRRRSPVTETWSSSLRLRHRSTSSPRTQTAAPASRGPCTTGSASHPRRNRRMTDAGGNDHDRALPTDRPAGPPPRAVRAKRLPAERVSPRACRSVAYSRRCRASSSSSPRRH